MGAIGDLALGDLEALAASAAVACLPGAKARFLRARIAAAFGRREAQAAKLARLAPAVSINVRAIFVMTRAEELVGEVRQSDQTALIEPTAFDGAAFPLPVRRGDRLIRWPGEAREHAMTVIETPAVYAAGDVDLLYRLIVRG